MFQPLAEDQISKFAAEGISLDPADVIRLNDAATALADAKGRMGGSLFSAPRCRWCGSVLFHEPTVQSELWMAEVAGELAANDESWGWMMAFSLAHADEPGFFECEELRTARGVTRACRDLQRRLSATRRELWHVVNWCRFGGTEPSKVSDIATSEIAAREERYRNALYADLAEAVALTGCGSEDLRRMTCPMLDRVIRTAWEREGRTFKDADVGARTREWYSLVSDMRSRKTR